MIRIRKEMIKKSVLLLVSVVILFCLPFTSRATVTIFPHSEGFEGAWPPPGWMSDGFTRSRLHKKIAAYSAKATLGATYKDWIVTDIIDCTGRYNIPFSLWYWVSSVDEDGPKIKIEGSIDGGRTWFLIDEFQITEEETFLYYRTIITQFSDQSACRVRISVGYKTWATCYLDKVKFGGSGITINSGTLTLANSPTLDMNGGITIAAAGVFDAGDANINLTGDWSNEGTFTYGTSTVTLDGTNQEVSGDTTFYNFTKSVPSSCTLTFESLSTQTITDTLTMTGSSGKVLTICSTSAGTVAAIEIPSSITSGVDYVDVKDNQIDGEDYHTNPSAETITPGANSVDSGNNTNWIFSQAPTNDSASVTDKDDTSYCYGGQEYTFQAVVSDPDGPDHSTEGIDTVELRFPVNGPSGTNYYAVRCNYNHGSEITWEETGSYTGYAALDGATSTTSVSSNELTVNFKITMGWEISEGTGYDIDINCTDEYGETPGWEELATDEFTYENDLIVYSVTYTADSADKVYPAGTQIDDNDWIRGETVVGTTGTITYEGSTNVYPPAAATIYAQLWTNNADAGNSYQDEITYANGTFTIADYTVPDESDTDYDFKIEIEGIPTGGSDETPAGTTVDSRIDADDPTGSVTALAESSDYLYADGTTAIYYGDDMPVEQTFTVTSDDASDGSGSGLAKITFSASIDPVNYPELDDEAAPWERTYGATSDDTDTSAITLTAYDNVGNFTEIDSVTVYRDITAPTDVANLTVNTVTQSSVVLTWTAVTETGSGLKGYTIYYNISGSVSRSDTPWDSEDDADLATLGTNHTTITGLSNEETYYFRLGAQDNVYNLNNLSNEVSATTTAAPGAGDVIINELMWMGSSGYGANDEWIELYNATSNAIDLSGWQLTKGAGETVMFEIPDGTTILANTAHPYLLITEFDADNSEIADISYGLSVYDSGTFTGVMVNAGDDGDANDSGFEISDTALLIKLYNEGTTIIDTAGDGSTPFAGDDTNKYSMERKTPPNSGEELGNWQDASTQVNLDCPDLGTPGAPNGAPAIVITINDWRELY
jgi:hypothetical protein